MITNAINNRFGSKKGLLSYLRSAALRLMGKYNYITQTDFNTIERFVFVCSGNICRSALGESVMKKLGGQTTSFGLNTRGGDPADLRMITFGRTNGYDLSSHITQPVSRFHSLPHDLLIGMEPSHCEQLRTYFPKHQVTALGLWLPSRNIYLHDPYSANIVYFNRCAENIVTATTNLYHQYDRKCVKMHRSPHCFVLPQ